MTRSMSAAEKPEAYRPPTTAPMLVPGDGIDGNVIFLEHLEHADVRGAARAATGEHQPDRGDDRCSLWRTASCAGVPVETVP